MKKYLLLIVGSLLLTSSLSFAKVQKPLALVWKGAGTCFLWCPMSAKRVAKQAGFRTMYVNKRTKNIDALLAKASLWVQPGGHSISAAKDMGPEFMAKIRNFVKDGGGYVGFCAGMLLTTKKIGSKPGVDVDGLGIVPGRTVHLVTDAEDRPHMRTVDTVDFGYREIYFSGGPYLSLEGVDEYIADGSLKVAARYERGEIAAIEATFGQGKVIVSGYHPETPGYWKFLRGVRDHDGSDRDIAREMMKRAIQKD